jgi:OOP family OmpA-OmpF porin
MVTRPMLMILLFATSAVAWAQSTAGPAAAAKGDQPVKPVPAAALAPPAPGAIQSQLASLPAKGLFVGDQLSDAAKKKLAELVIDAIGRRVEVAFIVPTGPWNAEGGGTDERDLTPKRLEAVKRYMLDRGVPPRQLVVESRIDAKLREPRLDVQVVTRPGGD